MTTNSVVTPVSFQERVEDILRRYDQTTVVAQAITLALPALSRTVESVLTGLLAQGQD